MININSNKVTRSILGILLGVVLGGALTTWVNAEPIKKKVNTNIFGVAIKGYDTVAYFTEGQAVKGNSKFSYNWNDAEWYFASAKNRDLFAADPDRYAPKYGGYWAGSLAATGKIAGVDPKAFKIIDGKLYLSWDIKGSDRFAEKSDEFIMKADENWVKLNEKNW